MAKQEQFADASESVRTEADRVQAEFNAIALQELYEERLQRVRSKKEQEEVRRLANLTTLERTQQECDRVNPRGEGMSRYRCSMPGDKIQPTIEVWAYTADDAEGRYRRICGILGSEHPIKSEQA